MRHNLRGAMMTTETEPRPKLSSTAGCPQLPRGVIASSMTPVDEDGEIQTQLLGPHIEWLIEEGVSAISPLGSSGEFVALSIDQRKGVLESVLALNNGRAHIMAGTGHYSTKKTIELSRHAEMAGADSLLIIMPYYMRPSKSDVLDHYRHIADQVSIPIVAYHAVTATGVDLLTEDLVKLVDEGVLSGVKMSNTDPDRVCQLLQSSDDCQVYVGLDSIAFEGLCHGAHGWISGIPSVVPRAARRLYDAIVIDGDLEQARIEWRPLSVLMRLQFEALLGRKEGPHWLSVAKATLNQIGPYVGDPILPLQRLNDVDQERLSEVLTNLGYSVKSRDNWR